MVTNYHIVNNMSRGTATATRAGHGLTPWPIVAILDVDQHQDLALLELDHQSARPGPPHPMFRGEETVLSPEVRELAKIGEELAYGREARANRASANNSAKDSRWQPPVLTLSSDEITVGETIFVFKQS